MERPSLPVYTGVRKHVHDAAGFSLWVPSDWTTFSMTEGHVGVMVGPFAESLETVLMAEKMTLPVTVKPKDAAILRKGFETGLKALPGIEIEQQEESLAATIMMFDARFTFLEGDVRRKRWVRSVYADTNHLLLIAQGKSPEEFEYWLPMFFNIMSTFELQPMLAG